MQLNSLHTLFVDQLRDLYNAETQLVRALPNMSSAATSPELKEAFNHHLDETRNQVKRLEEIFNDLKETPKGESCEAMQGLIEEGRKIIEAAGDGAVKDAALIAAAQRVEHYEIAGYGVVRTFADKFGYDRAKDLLNETLDEESSADSKLNDLATGGLFSEGINTKAMKTGA